MSEKKDSKLKISTEGKLKLPEKSSGSTAMHGGFRGRSSGSGNVTVEIRRTRNLSPKDVATRKQETTISTEKPASKKREPFKPKLEKISTIQEANPMALANKNANSTKPSLRSDKDSSTEDKTKYPVADKAKLGEANADKTSGNLRDKPPAKKEEERTVKQRISHGEQRRSSGKITVSQALSGAHQDERTRSLASVRRQREKAKKANTVTQIRSPKEQEKIIREVIITENMSVQELASRMAARSSEVIKHLMKIGSTVTVNDIIDTDVAEIVATDFGHKVKRVSESDVENVLIEEKDEEVNLQHRSPVVTVMGHVDHGKTSLLDALRKSGVADNEAGGITQHIGAYQVSLKDKKSITFLDTPGHEAFTQIRARGANITDIVVLVVAANDGIMEQTKEAINHAKIAKVPIIVAVNKIDLPEVDPQKIRTDLMNFDLVTEDFGGDIMAIDISAKQKTNLDQLLDAILLQAEMLDLKANSICKASGVVIETKLDKGRGVETTLLVQRGNLKRGDVIVVGATYGKVRIMINDDGKEIKDANPSQPVVIYGVADMPLAGDKFYVVENEKIAREVTNYRLSKAKSDKGNLDSKISLDTIFDTEEKSSLNILVKTDVHGSKEAVVSSAMKLSSEETEVKIIHAGVGAINNSDISLAKATNAKILAFNVRAISQAKNEAENEGVDIRYYSIIYNLIDDVKALIDGMADPKIREKFTGYAEVKKVFTIEKVGKIAGCMVTEGSIKRGLNLRLLRDNIVIHEGKLKTLKRFKDEVKEVKSGTECGMAFESYEDIKEGDIIEAFEIEVKK